VNQLMMSGMVFQVVALLLLGSLAGEYGLRTWRKHNELDPAAFSLRRSLRPRFFLGALVFAYSAALVRCVYHIADMSGGSSNGFMGEEFGFTICDSLLVLLLYSESWCC